MSDAASNSGSAAAATTTTTDPKTILTPKEEDIFKVAMLKCLKSGAPEIDYDLLTEHGKFNTKKTAQNTWGKIKSKVFAKAEDADGGASPKTPKAPKKAATPASRKRTKKESDGDNDDEGIESPEKKEATGSPTKKKRATPAKKGKKAAEAKSDELVKREDSPVDGEEGDNVAVKAKEEAEGDE